MAAILLLKYCSTQSEKSQENRDTQGGGQPQNGSLMENESWVGGRIWPREGKMSSKLTTTILKGKLCIIKMLINFALFLSFLKEVVASSRQVLF